MNSVPRNPNKFNCYTLTSSEISDRDHMLEQMVTAGWLLVATNVIPAPGTPDGLTFVDTLFWYGEPEDDESHVEVVIGDGGLVIPAYEVD